jgi:hypothetical protein
MKLSQENKNALLFQMHQIIYECLDSTINKFKNQDKNSLDYFVLTDEEEVYINKIKESPILHKVLEKILTRSLDDSFFNFLSIIDGTSEPLDKFGKKSDVLLIDMPDEFDEHYDFLHDDFFESYDRWCKIRG